MDNKIFAGIIVSLVALAGIGFIPEPSDTHYCESRNISEKCDSLSVYYGLPNGKCQNGAFGKLCTTGWISIDRLSEQGNFSNSTTTPTVSSLARVKVHTTKGGLVECEVINNTLDKVCYYKSRMHYRSEFE